MALNIQNTMTLTTGMVIENPYGRVAVVNNVEGNKIQYAVNLYISAEAFEAGATPFDTMGLILGGEQAYDYATDSKDILDLAHDALITILADQGIAATKSL